MDLATRLTPVVMLGVVLLASTIVSAAEPIPADQIVKLVDGVYPNPNITTPAGMQTYTVYRPTAETDKFSHNADIIFFKGKLYASWQATPVGENTHDSKGVFAVSEDGGKTWSAPVVLHQPGPEGTGNWRSPESLWTDGETLVSTCSYRKDGYPANMWITEIRTTTDGVNWTEPTQLMDQFCVQDFHVLPNGRQLMVGQGRARIDGNNHFAPRIFYNNKEQDGIGNWTESQVESLVISPGTGMVRNIEPAVFTRRDGNLVMLARDYSRSGNVLVSISYDNGETWSVPVESNIPENVYGNKQCAGNLPDGTPYFLFTPPGSGRGPLMLAVCGDGLVFDLIFEIRRNPPPLEFTGRAKYPGFSYPSAMVHDDKLYIIYATGKEHVEVSIIPLSSIPEPATAVLLGLGGLGLLSRRRNR